MTDKMATPKHSSPSVSWNCLCPKEIDGQGTVHTHHEESCKYGPASAVGDQTINFACGCFFSYWLLDGEIRSALACCAEHEEPHQTLANLQKRYEFEIRLKDGVVQVGTCDNCDLTIISTYTKGVISPWGHWYHNDPMKPNYRSACCIERGKSEHSSTVPHARAKEGSVRYGK